MHQNEYAFGKLSSRVEKEEKKNERTTRTAPTNAKPLAPALRWARCHMKEKGKRGKRKQNRLVVDAALKRRSSPYLSYV